MRFATKSGEVMQVINTYLENVSLNGRGHVSLYWVRMSSEFKAAIIRRHKGKVFVQYRPYWKQAIAEFNQLIHKEGVRSKDKRRPHTIALYVAPDQHSDLMRCIAVCRCNQKVADTLHKERVGAIAKAFKALNAECGCRHRKKYEDLDGHWFSTQTKADVSRLADRTIGRL